MFVVHRVIGENGDVVYPATTGVGGTTTLLHAAPTLIDGTAGSFKTAAEKTIIHSTQ